MILFCTFLVLALHCSTTTSPHLSVNGTTFYSLEIIQKGESETIVNLISISFSDTTNNMSSSLIKDIHLVLFVINERLNIDSKGKFDYNKLITRLERADEDKGISLTGAYTIKYTNYLQFTKEGTDFNLIFLHFLQNIAYDISNNCPPYFRFYVNDRSLADKNKKKDGTLVEISGDIRSFKGFNVGLSLDKRLKYIDEKDSYRLRIVDTMFMYDSLENYIGFSMDSDKQGFESNSYVKFLEKFAKDNQGFKDRYKYNAANRLVIIGESAIYTVERATFADKTCYDGIFNEGTVCSLTTAPDDKKKLGKETWDITMVKAESVKPIPDLKTKENTSKDATTTTKQTLETTHSKSDLVRHV